MSKIGRTEWRHRLILIAFSIAAALLVAELILRVAGMENPIFSRPDDERGWVLRAGARGQFTAEGGSYVVINQDGWRDREHSRAKPSGVLRIAVLGDSFVEAIEVPSEQTFLSVLEERLNRSGTAGTRRVEVLNFGVRGYGTAQELLSLRCCVWDYSPDLVLLAFYAGNDVTDNWSTIDRSPTNYARPYFRKTPSGWVEDRSFTSSWRYRTAKLVSPFVAHSRVLQLVIRAQHALKRPRQLGVVEAKGADSLDFRPSIYREPQDEAWRDAWRTTEDLVTTVADEVSQRGVRFAVVNLPTPIQVHPDSAVRGRFIKRQGVPDLRHPSRRIRALAQREGFPVLDLTSELQAYADSTRAFLHGFSNTAMGMGHWNSLGHRLGGEKIASWMADLIAENQ